MRRRKKKTRLNEERMLRKKAALQYGEYYLNKAKQAFSLGKITEARTICIEGIRLTSGPFYLAIRTALHELLIECDFEIRYREFHKEEFQVA
jgi:hypothetical protein